MPPTPSTLAAVEARLLRTHRAWFYTACTLAVVLSGVWLKLHVDLAMADYDRELGVRVARGFGDAMERSRGRRLAPLPWAYAHLGVLGLPPDVQLTALPDGHQGAVRWLEQHGMRDRLGSPAFAHVAWRWWPVPVAEALLILPGDPPWIAAPGQPLRLQPPPPPLPLPSRPPGFLERLLGAGPPPPPPAGMRPPDDQAVTVTRPLLPLLAPTFGLFAGLVVLEAAALATFSRAQRRAREHLTSELTLVHAKANFTAMVSHELKSPVAVLRLYAEMLRDGLVGEARRTTFYTTMAEEAVRLQRLVDNLLELGQIQAGSKAYKLAPEPLDELVDEAVAAQPPHAVEVVRAGRAGVAVLADRRLAVQAIANVIHNALKYGGGRPVEVEADATGAVHVRDRGPGIAPADRERIFEPYVRIGDEDTREVAGTGLGLALVKAYMDGHDGRVAVTDRAGGGSAFTLAFRPAQGGPTP